MTLVIALEWGERLLIVYNAHLESRMPADGQLRQIEELIEDMQRYPPETPMILAGDFNARSQPQRLIQRLREAGFQDAAGTDQPTVPPEDSAVSSMIEPAFAFVTGSEPRGEHRSIDWVFVRGPLEFTAGRVHDEMRASDHYPVSVELSLTAKIDRAISQPE